MTHSANERPAYTIGIDIGGTHIRIGLVSSAGELEHFRIESSSFLQTGQDPIRRLSDYIRSYMEGHPNADVRGIGIGFPSVISRDKKTVLATTFLAGFNQVNVADPLEAALRVPVYLDNDVNFLLFTEIMKHRLYGQGIVLGFYIGTGLGNAIYYQDHFIAGKHGSAAELGHIPILGGEGRCGCGNEGCIELIVSGKYLRELHGRRFADTPFEELFVRHGSDEHLLAFLDHIAVAIATEVNILDPDHIVLGGGVLHMKGFPREKLEAYIYDHARKPYPAESLAYIYAQENQEAGVLGAGAHVWNDLMRRDGSRRSRSALI